MKFHSDSEPGLGDIVASLSMGTKCTMEFRPRKNVDEAIFTNDRSGHNDYIQLGQKTVLSLELAHVGCAHL